MIDLSNKVRLGSILKTHGVHGELVLESKIITDTEIIELVFLEIEGKPVPFFIDTIREKSNQTYIIHFDAVNSESQADLLVHSNVFADETVLPQDNNNGYRPAMFEGYQLSNQQKQIIGAIQVVHESETNPLFEVCIQKQHVLVPAHPDLIIAVNHRKKSIQLHIPEGLLPEA